MRNKRMKTKFLLIILFTGFLMPLILHSEVKNVLAGVQDPNSVGERLLVYSELTIGDSIPALNWNGWNWAAMSLDNETSAPYEGTSSANLTITDVSGWWGLGIEKTPSLNLSKFANGHLIFSVKTDYNGTFHVGFQSTGQDAFLELIPGYYNYDNDSTWHQVIVPIVDIQAVNPLADLEDVTTLFVLYDDTDIANASIYFDDIYWQRGPKAVIYSETTTGVSYEGNSVWNNWVGTVEILDENSTAAEGVACKRINPQLHSNWWGMGVEVIPKMDFTNYIGGLFIFSINTTYEGNLKFGMQTGTYGLDHSDQFITISPGEYGYQNDGTWNQVIIPIDDLVPHATAVVQFDQMANPFVMMGEDPPAPIYDTPIYLDDIYWQAAVKPLLHNRTTTIYSELRDGDALLGNLSLNGWNGKASVTESTIDPFEGISCINITYVNDTWNWWGVGLDISEPENMDGYQGGTLNLMMKTAYTGNLSIGYQSYGGENAVLSITPGIYGYNNDNLWHKVVLPINDLRASNPDATLSAVTSGLMIMTEGDASIEPVFIDDVFWTKLNYIPSITNINLSIDATSGNLVLNYSYSDYEDDTDHSQIRWYKNGILEDTYNDLKSVPSSALVIDDEWYVVITPSDGIHDGEPLTSNLVTIPAPDDGRIIPGFPISTFLGFTIIAIISIYKKSKK